MKTFVLNGEKRELSNKQAIKTLRRNGSVPCVLYGSKQENIHFSVNEKELLGIMNTPYSFII